MENYTVDIYLITLDGKKERFCRLYKKLVDRTQVFKVDFEKYLNMFLQLNNSEYTENESGLN
jgi:hypothetical protein